MLSISSMRRYVSREQRICLRLGCVVSLIPGGVAFVRGQQYWYLVHDPEAPLVRREAYMSDATGKANRIPLTRPVGDTACRAVVSHKPI